MGAVVTDVDVRDQLAAERAQAETEVRRAVARFDAWGVLADLVAPLAQSPLSLEEAAELVAVDPIAAARWRTAIQTIANTETGES